MPRAIRAVLLAGATGALFTVAAEALADDPFVDRPLTLPPLHLSADAGVGFGQFQTETIDAQGNTFATGMKLGWGSNLEGAVGLPFLGEIGVRVGIRFGDDGVLAGWGLGADHFARLFDSAVTEPGTSAVTNPEVRLRGTVMNFKVVEIGLETRAIIPTSQGSDFELSPGVPVRVHVPGFARIDAGVWLPIVFSGDPGYTIDLPAQLFFQAGQAFFGPVTGVRYNHPGGAAPSSTDVPAGLAGGYTLAGVLDLKAQLRTERINAAEWSKYIGGGIGVGLRIP